MALLDVSDVVLDPDFADPMICLRSTQTIGENGRASNASTSLPFWGVVTQADGSQLTRDSNGEKLKGSITVHSKFLLIDGNQDKTADIITFKGVQYTVSRVDSYSHFGQGFTAATCDLLPLQGI